MHRISKLFGQSVTGVTDKVMSTVSNIKRDFTRRSKRRKQEKKEKKLKKMQQVDVKISDEDVEHKYKLVCDLPNCEFHPKPNAYEDFLNTLWCPKSNGASSHGSQIMIVDEDKKSNLSYEREYHNKENFITDAKLDAVKEKLSRFDSTLKDASSSSCTDDSSSESLDNLDDILRKDSIKLTITNENGETKTVIATDELSSSALPIQACGKCMICFNKLKSPLDILPCTHLFHSNCIIQWLDIKSTCPLCNQHISEQKIEKYKQRWSE